MSADINIFDPVKANGYSDDPRFDMAPPRSQSQASDLNIEPSEEVTVNPELSMTMTPSKEWEVDVKALISTKKWLSTYGLKKNRLDMFHIMPQIGFKHSEDFDHSLKKPVSSKYASGLFQKYLRSDGKMFNVSCSKEKMRQIEHRLSQAISLYKRRLDWLTSESRRVFGTIEEKSVSIVLDIRNMSPKQFDQFRSGLERVIKEQVSFLSKFNIIRACEDLDAFSRESVPVTMESINRAVKWLWDLKRTAPVSNTSTCEAVLKAMGNNQIDAVYLYTEGSSSDTSRQLLKEKLSGARIPTHVVSFNCTKAETIKSLKNLAKVTGGRFHAYAVVMELDSYEMNNNSDGATSHSNVILKKKTYGGVPSGAGMREDVILLFEEIEEARNALSQVQGIIASMPDARASIESANNANNRAVDRSETYMSSREWLNKYGLRAKKLGFYDVLAGVAFKHRDGVVELSHAPEGEYQTDALRRDKLINARYCDKFPHVRWKDGQVVHVQVTPEMHRSYEQRVNLTLNAAQQRIDWLQQGSRELFGTVIEDQIYILIDTSASMAPHIQFVKDKLFVLMQEQLRHKQKFNLIAFDSNSVPWQSRLVDVNEKNLHHAWQWIKGLSCRGSTNTLAALRHALNDPLTQSVYLLTDGRPDQPAKSILAQVMLHPQVPIHTISFNCSDREANEFLCRLAKETSGRFHYYSENGIDPEGPEPWESEDIRLLRLELEQGYRNLERIATLRDECAALAWKKDDPKKEIYSPGLSPNDLFSRAEERPKTASGARFSPAPPNARSPSSSASRARLVVRPNSGGRSPRNTKSSRPFTAGLSRSLPNQAGASKSGASVAGHTRTSLLRTLNSSGQFDREWLLPETKELFDRQSARQLKAEKDDDRKLKRRNKQKKRYTDPMLMTSRKWLSRNGLSALKLTILDALAPTFIPHTATYVPVLKQHVISRVFDKIMPFAHTNVRKEHHVGPERAKVNIINPDAVNLEAYIKKVEKAAKRYEDRLDRLVWNALPETTREGIEGSKSFMKNRTALTQALNEFGWKNITEDDISLLETEIEQAWGYIEQARGLIEASKKNKEESAESASEASVRSTSPSSSARPTSGRPSSGRLNIQPKKKIVKKRKQPRRLFDQLRGQRVIGRNADDGFYYAGSVMRCTDIRHAITEFDELGTQKVPTRFLIQTSGAISVPHLMAGDYVLARVVNQETNLECYVPGVVQMTPKVVHTKSKYFTVVLYTGQKDHFLRSYLVKISKLRYLFLVRYILDLNPTEEQEDEEDGVDGGAEQKVKSSLPDSILNDKSSPSIAESESKRRSRPRLTFEIKTRSSSASLTESRSRSRSKSSSSSRSLSYDRAKSRIGQRPDSRSDSRSSSDERSKSRFARRSDSKAEHRSRSISLERSISRSETKSRSRSPPHSPHSNSPQSESHVKSKTHVGKSTVVSSPKSSTSSVKKTSKPQTPTSARSSTSNKSDKKSLTQSKSESELQKGLKSESLVRSKVASPSPSLSLSTSSSGLSSKSQLGDTKKSRKKSSDVEMPRSPTPPPPNDDLEKERLRLERWQHHLEEMQRSQRKDQKRLKRQARKLEKLRLRLKDSHSHNDNEQRRLLELILQETKNKEEDRTSNWVQDQNVEIALDKEKGDILVSSGDKGVLISRTEQQESIIMKMRRTLCRLKVGEEVLARWTDEGWYYRGTVKQQIDEYSYYIQDGVGNLEAIFREDIISDRDDANAYIKVKETVVALHPNYMFSYAPGIVMETKKDFAMAIRFYDGHEARVPREDIYRIPSAKFELDVAYVVKCEAGWVGQAVVARNDDTGVFQLGAIRERIGDGRQYVVERSDGQLAIQVATCIFGAFTKRHELNIGDHTLAIMDNRSLIYLPGTVTDTHDGRIVVEFCNGIIGHNIDPAQCFWLSRDYFKNAVDFYKQRQAAIAGGLVKDTVWTKNNERLTTKTTYELIEEKVERVEITSDQEDKDDDKRSQHDSSDDDRDRRQRKDSLSSRSSSSSSHSEDDRDRKGNKKHTSENKDDDFFD